VFGKPNNKNNVFKPNQNRPQPQQTPMSGVSTSKFKPLPGPSTSNNYNPPKFVFEELYNAETDHNQPEQNYYDQNYVDHDPSQNTYYENQDSDSHVDTLTSEMTYDLSQNKTYNEPPVYNTNFYHTPQGNNET
jgi:hypothetical protein